MPDMFLVNCGHWRPYMAVEVAARSVTLTRSDPTRTSLPANALALGVSCWPRGEGKRHAAFC